MTSSVLTSTKTLTFYSTVASSGLQLLVTLNASSVKPSQSLAVEAILFNGSNESVSAAPNLSMNLTLLQWAKYNSICPGLSGLYGLLNYALYRGHVTAANLSQAGNPLILTPPVGHSCPNLHFASSYFQKIEFDPGSDVAAVTASSMALQDNVYLPKSIAFQLGIVTGLCTTSPYNFSATTTQSGTVTSTTGVTFSWSCGGGRFLSGYWTWPASGADFGIDAHNSTTITNSINMLYQEYLHPFAPGWYTVAAEDSWNQTAFAYFQVVSP